MRLSFSSLASSSDEQEPNFEQKIKNDDKSLDLDKDSILNQFFNSPRNSLPLVDTPSHPHIHLDSQSNHSTPLRKQSNVFETKNKLVHTPLPYSSSTPIIKQSNQLFNFSYRCI